ncbi:MAG: NusG domain II-containing protein [Clostridia bacterium]|nr:NusG domain II-containing protein [Clostridia bacterium]
MKAELFRKGDIAVILVILVAVALFLGIQSKQTDKLEAVITVNGETVETIDLSLVKEKQIFEFDTTPKVIIAAENGEIYFEYADCDDKLCINCGKLSRKGDTAVCLPARTVVTVSGSDVGVMTY